MLNRQQGFTVTEMIIGLALGIIVLSIALGAYIQITRSSRLYLTEARLEHDLTTTLELMVRDLRRAGYWHKAGEQPADRNPFTSDDNDIRIDRYGSNEQANSCLTYSYDLDDDGMISQSPNEQFGFRLRNMAVELRIGGDTFNCQQGNWQKITPAGTIVTALAFEIKFDTFNPLNSSPCSSGRSCLQSRLIYITLSGHPAGQPTDNIVLTTATAVRNHKRI